MTTTRSYREAMPDEEAARELVAHAGSQFDPTVVANGAAGSRAFPTARPRPRRGVRVRLPPVRPTREEGPHLDVLRDRCHRLHRAPSRRAAARPRRGGPRPRARGLPAPAGGAHRWLGVPAPGGEGPDPQGGRRSCSTSAWAWIRGGWTPTAAPSTTSSTSPRSTT
jgi:hypothetical protein